MKLSTALIKEIGTTFLLLSLEGKWGLLKGIDAKGPKRTRQKKEANDPAPLSPKGKGGKIVPDECTIDRFAGGEYYYNGGCGGMTFVFSIKCEDNILEDGGCTFTEVSQDGSCGFNSYTFNPKHYIRELEESGDCVLGLPFLPLQPRDETESCAKSNLSIQFVAKKGVGPAQEMDIYFSDDYGWVSKRGPYEAYHVESERVRKLKLQSDKLPLVAFHDDSQRMLQSTCGSPLVNLTVDSVSGDLILNGNDVTNDPRFHTSATLGSAYNAITIIDNIDIFTIPAGTIVNVIGAVIVEARQILIDGTLNGNGYLGNGGWPGGREYNTEDGQRAFNGWSPPDTNGQGGGGKSVDDYCGGYAPSSINNRGGGGGGSHSGRGGRGGGSTPCIDLETTKGSRGDTYDDTADSLPQELRPGSGGGAGAGWRSNQGLGGAGGFGGASITLNALEDITINGVISANGGTGGDGVFENDIGNALGAGGGGSGGAIKLSATTINTGPNSKIEAKGGSGGQGRNYGGSGGGGGGGGVVALEASSSAQLQLDGSTTIEVDGGAGGAPGTGAGGISITTHMGLAGSDGIIDLSPYLTVFVTSTTHKGNLGGVSGADNKCQDLADNAGLDGTFKAWISQSASSSPAQSWSPAISNRPYYLADGTTKVADDWYHLFNALSYELHHAIDQNENGQTVTDAVRAWTNTNWNGNVVSTDDCDGWSRSGSNWQGKYGGVQDKNHNWSWKGEVNCNWEIRLYCIQQNTSA